MELSSEYISLTEAALISGISRPTLRRIRDRGALTPYEDPRDRRKTLLRRADVESLKHIRPARQGQLAEVSAA